MSPRAKKYVKRFALLLFLSPLLLLLLVMLLLYVPPLQRQVARQTASYLSEQLGMEITLGAIHLGFPLDLRLSELRVIQPTGDTLASLGELSLSPSLLPLLSKQVEVPEIALKRLTLHYTDSTEQTRLQVLLPQAVLERLSVDLSTQQVALSRLATEGGQVHYTSTDTTTSQGSSEPLRWVIQATRLDLRDTRLEVALPHDSLYIQADVPRLQLDRGIAHLETMRFLVAHAELHGRSLSYAVDRETPARPYIDYQHISLQDYHLEAQDILSEKLLLDLKFQQAKLTERSGLTLQHLAGHYQMDTLGMQLRDLDLVTDASTISGEFAMPWSLLKSDPTAEVLLRLRASLGRKDLLLLGGAQLASSLDRSSYAGLMRQPVLPPLRLDCTIEGTPQSLQVKQAKLDWQDYLRLDLAGSLQELFDAQRISGELRLEAALGAQAPTLLPRFAPELASTYRLPAGLRLAGDVAIRRGHYQARLQAQEGAGSVSLQGSYTEATKSYQASLQTQALDLQRFLPADSLGVLHAELSLQGRGFDPLARPTQLELHGKLHSLQRGNLQLQDVTLDGRLHQGELALSLNSLIPGANFTLQLDGLISSRSFSAGLGMELVDLDLQSLGLSDSPLKAKLRLEGELRSDLKESHHLTAGLDGMSFVLGEELLTPPRADLTLTTTAEQSVAHLSSQGFLADLSLAAGPTELQKTLSRLTTETLAQVKLIASGGSPSKSLEQLVTYLPTGELSLRVGRDNPLRYYLARERIAIGSLEGKLSSSPQAGLQGTLALADLRVDTLRIDLAQLNLSTERATIARGDSLSLVLFASVMKSRFRQQEGFTISADLRASLEQGHLDFAWQDGRGVLQHAVELAGAWGGDTYRLRLLGDELRVAYNSFKIAPSSQLSLRKRDLFLLGSLHLQGLQRGDLLLEALEPSAGLQDLTLSIKRLHLEDFRSLGLPDLGGILYGDLHYQRQGDLSQQPTISGDLSLSDLRYEDKRFGLFSASLFYEPRSGESHYITADLGYNGLSALSLDGIYYPKQKTSPLTGAVRFTGFPLELANPFLLASGTSLQGALHGDLALSGKLASPLLSGKLQLQQGLVDLADYGAHLQLDTLPVRFEDSSIYFDHYALRPSSDPQRALYIDGAIRQATSPEALANLRLTSDQLTLLNEPRPTKESQLLYGKIIASTSMSVTGRMTALRVRGAVNILSGTNCTYILRESPLTAEQSQSQLVEFVDMADTLFAKQPAVAPPTLGGLDVNLTIQLDPSVRLGAALTADGADYVDARGGGTLHFTYPPYGEMNLTGRYEMSGGGELSYTLPVVGNKRFTIDPTSTLTWYGPVANPYLNFSAVNRVKASVSSPSGVSERVNFNVSVRVKDYVDRMNLSFELAAPENLSMQNALSTMTPEEQSKQAIALMATGVYLGSGSGAGNLNLNAALTSLLQSQINRTAGKLLQGTDLSIGMDRYDGSTGEAAHTDYTYSFSRRFYNDRIRIIVGGKVQSGAGAQNQAQTFLDNVSLQYQLDRTGEQYLSLYHKLVTDNVLEGEFTETGVGYVLRRKVNSLLDLFRFRKRAKSPSSATPIQRELWRPSTDTLPALRVDTLPAVRPAGE